MRGLGISARGARRTGALREILRKLVGSKSQQLATFPRRDRGDVRRRVADWRQDYGRLDGPGGL